MSSARHATDLSDSFTGFGYLPDLTPFKNDVGPKGINAGTGGTALELPMICQSFKKATAGTGLDDVVML